MKEVWYTDKGFPYPENDSNYYDVKDFPALADIEKHWDEIKPEIKRFIDEKDKSFRANSYQNINIEGAWSSLPFIFWSGILSNEFRKKCPVSWAYLMKIKGITSLSLSLLSPHSSIARHRGDTNAVIRCHLGIEVPERLPQCGLKVKEEERGWAEGKWLLFNDACIHSAWNNSDMRRIVLIIDVIRPEFLKRKTDICTHILTYQIINNQMGRSKSFKDSSFFVKTFLFGLVYSILSVYRPVLNFIRGT